MLDINHDNHLDKVKTFMQKCGQDTPESPCLVDEQTALLRSKLIMEECLETIRAMGVTAHFVDFMDEPAEINFESLHFAVTHPQDIVEIIDGVADINVVANGTAIAYGVDMSTVQPLVDDSNLAKFTGDAHMNEYGKWIKPSDWVPPNIADEIGEQMIKTNSSCGGNCDC